MEDKKKDSNAIFAIKKTNKPFYYLWSINTLRNDSHKFYKIYLYIKNISIY